MVVAAFSRSLLTVVTLSLLGLASSFCPSLHPTLPNTRAQSPATGGVACNSRACGSGSGSMSMRYVAMNNFKVKLGNEEEFERIWRERESKLESCSGFIQFMMLKLDSEEDRVKSGYQGYISHTTWMHKLDFESWRKSSSFKGSHGGDKKPSDGDAAGPPPADGAAKGGPPKGGMSRMKDILFEPPKAKMFEAVIVEPQPAEELGGLFDFEEAGQMAYFD